MSKDLTIKKYKGIVKHNLFAKGQKENRLLRRVFYYTCDKRKMDFIRALTSNSQWRGDEGVDRVIGPLSYVNKRRK